MKERNTIHAFLLHYGISTVLLCMLVAMEGEKLTFTIQSVMEEPDYYVVCMTPEVRPVVERAFRGNSKLSGYVYTHKVKLWHLVFSKISLNKNTLW